MIESTDEMNPVEKIAWLTENGTGNDPFKRLSYLVEEVGECAAALNAEAGLNNKGNLKESAKDEAVDCIITALSMYFACKGTQEELVEIMERKVGKWMNTIREIKNAL